MSKRKKNPVDDLLGHGASEELADRMGGAVTGEERQKMLDGIKDVLADAGLVGDGLIDDVIDSALVVRKNATTAKQFHPPKMKS